MAAKPSPDRTDLESKTREDLQPIAKVKGVELPARASKAALIEAIMGDAGPSSNGSETVVASRAVRSRRTVATPTDDFEDLLGEFVADACSSTAPEVAAPAPAAAVTREATDAVTAAAPSAATTTSGLSPAPGARRRIRVGRCAAA